MQQVEHPLFYENLSYAANKTIYGSSCASNVTLYMPSAKGPRHTDIITENALTSLDSLSIYHNVCFVYILREGS